MQNLVVQSNCKIRDTMKKAILVIIASIMLGCNNGREPQDINCLYKGAIIYQIHDFRKIDGTMIFKIKYKNNFFRVKPYEIDHDYKLGDTIKKPCLTSINL